MKIPYIKLYTADLLAATRDLTSEQIGDLIVAVCEQAFSKRTLFEPKTEREKEYYEMFKNWKEESEVFYKTRKKVARKGGLALTKKRKLLEEAASTCASTANVTCQTETDTETDTDTETETKTEKDFLKEKKKNFSLPLTQTGSVATPVCAAEAASNLPCCEPAGEPPRDLAKDKTQRAAPRENSNNANEENTFSSAKTLAQETKTRLFLAEVQRRFEPTVQTDGQKQIWQRRNSRALQEILTFCKEDISQALAVIDYCKKQWREKGYIGGYDAICRHLPDYYAQATHTPTLSPGEDLHALRQAQARAAQEQAYRALELHARKNGVTPPDREAFLAQGS